MKNLTKNDVLAAANKLIAANGSTTTLDVKRELRNDGFKAYQTEVSALMAELNNEEGWDSTTDSSNGPAHQVYSNGNANTTSSTITSTGATNFQDILTRVNSITSNETLGVLDANNAENVFDDLKAEFNITDPDFTESSLVGQDATGIAKNILTIMTGATGAVQVQKKSVSASSSAKSTKTGRRKYVLAPVSVFTDKNNAKQALSNNAGLNSNGIGTNDWVVTSANMVVAVYPGNESRDRVRSNYACDHNVRIQTTRACRVKRFK